MNKRLADKEIKIAIAESARELIVEQAYDPVYGARPLKRYLQKHVETLLARMILSDQVSMGDTVTLKAEDGKIVAE